MVFSCCWSDDQKDDRDITKKIRHDKRESKREVKLLLLGAGESGKSTIVKQARIIHGDGYTDKQLIDFAPVIYLNIIRSMQALLQKQPDLGIEFEAEADEQRKLILSLDTNSMIELTGPIRDAIRTLWKLPSIAECYGKRSMFQLNDSSAYYFDAMDRIGAAGYIPSQDDVLRSRVPTTGIVEYKFAIEDVTFRLVDVGGQRSERRKWIHCFSGVTSIIFIVALSEYDQTLFEDRHQSRMRESIALFDNIVNYDWFADTSMILFLNKLDLFEEKLPNSPFNKYFPEFKEDSRDEAQVKWFILHMFFQLNKNEQKTIYSHFTCATDTKQMQVIFNAVRDTILQNNLKLYHLI